MADIRHSSGQTKGLPTMGIRTARTHLRTVDTRRLKPPAKVADSIYSTPEFKQWRAIVMERAGSRCEAMVDGRRCLKAAPRHRMFADHKVEIRDGGAPFDPDNGQCLCGSHHSTKTAAARAARR